MNAKYLNPRVLKLNVGFLLSDGPGHSHDSEIDFPAIRLSDDLATDFLRGPLRLSRTQSGILVQATLQAGFVSECYRCLDALRQDVDIEFEELFAYPLSADAEFGISDDGMLDLGPLVRAELLIATAHGLLCRSDCQGLCPECGENRNHGVCACHIDSIDPRLAMLQQLLNSDDT